MIEKKCQICNKKFKVHPYRIKTATTCSPKCSLKKMHKDSKGCKRNLEQRKKYSISKKGINNPHWIDGRSEKSYIYIYKTDYPCLQKRRMFKHRYIMEQILGRKLKPTEVVDHINQIPYDNRIENLRLFNTNSDHIRYHSKKRYPPGSRLGINLLKHKHNCA